MPGGSRRVPKHSAHIGQEVIVHYPWHPFPNAACVVSLIDRLTHNSEVIALEGESYRLKEAQERAEQRAQRRRRKKS